MNIRKITENYGDTLLTLEKIFNEYQFEPVSSKLNNLSDSIKTKELKDPEFKFISAFENGAEIGVLVTRFNEICALSIKKYAQKRGVGRELMDYYLKSLPDGEKVIVHIEPEFESFYNDLGFERNSDPVKKLEDIDYITLEYIKGKN